MVLSSYQSSEVDKRQSDRFLSSCITIKEERVSRHRTIPRQVCFELNLDIIDRIEEIKQKSGSLYLEREKLTDLRYYSLINSPIRDNFTGELFPLVFISNYLLPYNQFPTTVVRSTINLEGKILQEIQQDLWHDRQLSSRVIQAHHWLTTEILRQLPLEHRSNSRIVFWALWILVVIISTYGTWFLVTLPLFLKIAIALACSLLLKILIQYLLKYQLRKWILEQLTTGWLSNKTHKRQIGFNLLSESYRL